MASKPLKLTAPDRVSIGDIDRVRREMLYFLSTPLPRDDSESDAAYQRRCESDREGKVAMLALAEDTLAGLAHGSIALDVLCPAEAAERRKAGRLSIWI